MNTINDRAGSYRQRRTQRVISRATFFGGAWHLSSAGAAAYVSPSSIVEEQPSAPDKWDEHCKTRELSAFPPIAACDDS